jgi:predicted phosphodiesterase
MKIAVLSDIHANDEALTQVFADIDRSGVTQIICLGDVIGYGPEPDRSISLLREWHVPTLLGNHELAVSEPQVLEWFNPDACISLEKTIPLLSHKSRRYISGLAPYMVAFNCRFVHGFPPDSCMTYLTFVTESSLKDTFEKMTENICFLGHTHTLEIVSYNGNYIERSPLRRGITGLDEDNKYIINVGSVGQPRDGNNKAKYVIWDTLNHTVEVRFVSYNIQKVANKILEIGLPEIHARRLW